MHKSLLEKLKAYYWLPPSRGILSEIKNQELKIQGNLETLESLSEAGRKSLFAEIIEMQKIKAHLVDENIDIFKDILYVPAKGSAKVLALCGLVSVASLVVGPAVSFVSAVAFLCTNVYRKGANSWLNFSFMLASALQLSALILGVCVIAGMAINPIIIGGLSLAGSGYLFVSAVTRGARRHREAEELRLAEIDKNITRCNNELAEIDNALKNVSPELINEIQKSIGAAMQQKDIAGVEKEMDALDLCLNDLTGGELKDQIKTSVKNLIIYNHALSCELGCFQDLLRTVKNPFTKLGSIRRLSRVKNKVVSGDKVSLVKRYIQKQVENKLANMHSVWRKDLVTLSETILLITIASVGIMAAGGLAAIGISAFVISPPVAIFLSVCTLSTIGITGVFLARHYWRNKKNQQKQMQDEQDFFRVQNSSRAPTGTRLILESKKRYVGKRAASRRRSDRGRRLAGCRRSAVLEKKERRETPSVAGERGDGVSRRSPSYDSGKSGK